MRGEDHPQGAAPSATSLMSSWSDQVMLRARARCFPRAPGSPRTSSGLCHLVDRAWGSGRYSSACAVWPPAPAEPGPLELTGERDCH